MNRAAREVCEASRFVAVLSLDEPMNTEAPWRWFTAAGWVSTAVLSAMASTLTPTPADRALADRPVRTPEPEAPRER